MVKWTCAGGKMLRDASGGGRYLGVGGRSRRGEPLWAVASTALLANPIDGLLQPGTRVRWSRWYLLSTRHVRPFVYRRRACGGVNERRSRRLVRDQARVSDAALRSVTRPLYCCFQQVMRLDADRQEIAEDRWRGWAR